MKNPFCLALNAAAAFLSRAAGRQNFRCVLPLALAALLTAESGMAEKPAQQTGAAARPIGLARLLKGNPAAGKVSVRGHQFLKEDMIRPHIRLKAGRPFRLETVRADVRRLFDLGFFEDIEVHAEPLPGGAIHVIYQLKERPMLEKLEFKGSRHVKPEDLRELSKISESEFLSPSALRETLSAIREKYKKEGYFLADVSYKIIPLKEKDEGGRRQKKSKLVIEIEENSKIIVRSVNFIGNRRIPSKDLKAFMALKERDVLSLLGGAAGSYSPEAMDRDLRALEYYYRDRGFLNVRLEKPEISISPDQREIYISIAVSEGPQFTVSAVEFPGDEIVPAERAAGRLSLKEGKPFSLGSLHKDLELVKSLYGQKGYAFAEVRPRISPDPLRESAVRVIYEAKKGERYKTGRIIVRGNSKIRDRALLRRLGLMEGEIYDESKKKLAEALLRQTGYFESVDLALKKRKAAEGGPAAADLLLTVREKETTGEFQAIGGYDTYSKLFVRLRLKNNSLFGLDHSLFLEMNFNRYQEMLSLRYINPYFLDTDWNFGFELFNTGDSELSGLGYAGQSNFFSQQQEFYSSYSRVNTGFSVSFGRRLTPFFDALLKYRLQRQSLSGDSLLFIRKLPLLRPVFQFLFGEASGSSGLPIFDDIFPLEEGEGINSSISGIFEYDRRNDRLSASKGYYGRASLEYSGLGGDFDYLKAHAAIRRYQPLVWGLVLKTSLNYGALLPAGGAKKPLFTELFKLGGSHSLRGFPINSVAPRKYSQDAYNYAVKEGFKHPRRFAEQPYGGSRMFYFNGELEFPLISRARLRGAVFFDMGEANDKLSFHPSRGLRANTGFGLRWASPMGPVRLDWGVPFQIKEEYGEKNLEFHFSMGSPF